MSQLLIAPYTSDSGTILTKHVITLQLEPAQRDLVLRQQNSWSEKQSEAPFQ